MICPPQPPLTQRGRDRRVAEWLQGIHAEVPDALAGHLNREELARTAVAGVLAGGVMFVAIRLLAQVGGPTFPAPVDAALAATVWTLLREGQRRLAHGTTPWPSRSHRLVRGR